MNSLIKHDDIVDTRELSDALSDLIDDSELPEDEQEHDADERTAAIAAYVKLALAISHRSVLTDHDAMDVLDDADNPLLIADSYFEDYAMEYADEIGAIDSSARWPLAHIDWKAAAEELQSDYTSITFDDCDYWMG